MAGYAANATPVDGVAALSQRRVPMIIGCALFMELVDATAVLTALPQMASDFGESSLTTSVSVALSAAARGLLMAWRGHPAATAGDIGLVILMGAVLCAASGLVFMRLSATAGSSVYQSR
ncbi:hypothetical protein EGJ27_03220 [Pseudomonas sp. v388]|uniref:hypothetical protein n=1 Tax=Pseudomonas sp. v388 TaxID=2479849 RepID=UPI000F7BA02D|nr:hypothetical protein [Pseudomonas sp. v388]RRV10638.1 hypothetical protein EGJ27_03220 [Pseudomonas sp. v388]